MRKFGISLRLRATNVLKINKRNFKENARQRIRTAGHFAWGISLYYCYSAQFHKNWRARQCAIAQMKVFTIVKNVVLHKKELDVLLIDDRKKCGYNQNIVIKYKIVAQ